MNEWLSRDIQTPNARNMKLTLNIKRHVQMSKLSNTYWHKHTDIIMYGTVAKDNQNFPGQRAVVYPPGQSSNYMPSILWWCVNHMLIL